MRVLAHFLLLGSSLLMTAALRTQSGQGYDSLLRRQNESPQPVQSQTASQTAPPQSTTTQSNRIQSAIPQPGQQAPDQDSYLLVPSADSFYDPPEGWETKSPGDILRARSWPYPVLRMRNAANTFQIMYRSSDTHRNASWSTAVVFIPNSHRNCSTTNPDGCAHGVVFYQVAYDSASFDASPSYLFQFGDPYQEIPDMLNRGWFVVGTDYEGPSASYADGPQAGYATLDAARAMLKIGPTYGLRADQVKMAVMGYSGGSQAAGFTAELAANYAPDLKLAGVLIGGPSPNLTTSAMLMNKKDTAGLLIASLFGITAQQPEARAYLLSRLKTEGPYNVTGLTNVLKMSGSEALTAYPRHDIFDYFIDGAKDLDHPLIQDIIRTKGNMGLHGTPNMPVFIYKAIEDEMSPVSETDHLYETYCKGGGNVLYHRNSIGGHNQELLTSRPRAMKYLHTVLDGIKAIEKPEVGCLTVNVTLPLNLTEVFAPSYQTPGPRPTPIS